MSETAKRLKDVVVLLLVASAGIFALHAADEMTTFGSIFPRFASDVIVVGSAALLVQALFFQRAAVAATSPASGRAWLLALLLLAWALLLPITGFVVTSLLGSAGVLAISQLGKPTWQSLLLQAGSSAAFVFTAAFIFDALLNVPLP